MFMFLDARVILHVPFYYVYFCIRSLVCLRGEGLREVEGGGVVGYSKT